MIVTPEPEWPAFNACCERLAGFDGRLSFEYVDGFLAALASGPQTPPVPAWLDVLCGDTFERVFADPQDHAQALAALQARLRVLQRQLDPDALFDAPDELQIDPFVMEWTDEARAAAPGDDDDPVSRLGLHWAQGFFAALRGLPRPWPEPTDEPGRLAFDDALERIAALALPAAELQAYQQRCYGKDAGTMTREDLLADACLGVQDLRMLCVDYAPVTETRRVGAKPGRNDPCPCGSGKKYKKCHGAA